MYRKPRRRRWRGWLAALIAAVVVGLGIFGLVKLITGTPNLDRDAVMLPTSNPNGVFPWENGLLCVEQNQLYCTDLKGDSIWQVALPMENGKVRRTGNLTVVWGGKTVLLIDEKGVIKNVLNTDGDVVLAAPGLNNFAVVTKEEGQHRLRFYSTKDKSTVDEIKFPYESVLDIGYFGENLSQLWILAVDSNGTRPATKLTMYYPGKKTTGEINLTDELGYAAYVEDKMTYVVSTHTLTFWEHAGTKKADKPSKLIYGWNLQDALVDDTGRVSFLFSPSGEGATGQISALWYIGAGGAEYRIPLPAGCTKAMLKANGRICVAAGNGVYSMAQNGTGSRFYPISSSIDSIPAVVPGKAFVVQEKHRNYLINMP